MDTELLERERECAALERAAHTAAKGRGRVVVIEGPIGAGKSRLIAAAAEIASRNGLRTLHAIGGELESQLGYGLVRMLLEQAVRTSESLVFAGQLRPAAAIFEMEGWPPGVGVHPGESAISGLHSLHRLLAELARERPLALLIDDAQWADPPSSRLLAFVGRRLDELPVLMVLASRREPGSEPLLQGLTATPNAAELEPQPLSEQATIALVRSLHPGASEELGRACHSATGGNPLYLHELAISLELDPAQAATLLAGGTPRSPVGVTRVVNWRLQSLDRDAIELARAAAVLGQAASLREAGALARLPPQARLQAADTLRAASILANRPELEFEHPIIRGAVYDGIRPGAVAAAHARAAALLLEENAPAERIAAHLLATEPSGEPRVCEQLVRAGSTALERGAPELAARYLARALEEPPPDAMSIEILLALGTAEAVSFQTDAAVEHLCGAFERSTTLEHRVSAAMTIASASTHAGRASAGIPWLVRVLDEIGEDHPLAPVIEAHVSDAARFETESRLNAAPITERLRERVRSGGCSDPVALASVAAETLMAGESVQEAAHLASAAIASLGDAPWLAPGETPWIAARVLFSCDRFDEAGRLLDEGLAAAQLRGAAMGFGLLSAFRAECSFRRGDLAAAQLDAANAYELAREHDWHTGLPGCTAHLARALLARGAGADAVRVIDAAGLNGDAETLPEIYTINLLLHARGELALAQGETAQALADLLECGRRQLTHGEVNPALVPWRSAAAHAYFILGDAASAQRLAAEELQLARTFGAARALGIALQAVARTDPANRVAALEQAVEVLRGSGAQLELAASLAELGTERLHQHDLTAARVLLREALELAYASGAQPLEQQVISALRAAGLRPRRRSSSGPDSLTPSQRRVAELAAGGASNREIADGLFVTVRTVEYHLAGAFKKLGIHSRSQVGPVLAEGTGAAARARPET